MAHLKLSKKQYLGLKLLNDPQIVDLLWGGGAGSGKTFLICTWIVMQCRDYPGVRIGLGRKELTRLKQTTVTTLLREVHQSLGIKIGEFIYSDHRANITYSNASSIQFVDLAPQPSDPNFDSFGSLNFTHCVAEEIGEVNTKARDMFFSRKNRFLNEKYKLVGKSVSTCNPSQNYAKVQYYKPYKNLGGGEYQKWEYGNVEINGEMKVAYRAYVPSLATNNPFLPQNYIEVLRKLPDAERKRLLEGNWDFEDNDAMIFKSTTIDRGLVDVVVSGEKYIGADIADTGSDQTIFTLIEGNTIVEQREINVDKNEAIGEQIALELIKYAQQNGIDSSKAKNIGVDTLGVGASTRDFLRSKGWRVNDFIAGAASTSNFKNLRGETIYGMGQALDQGKLKIFTRLKTLDKLREQLMAHEYTTEERTIVVKSKKIIKETLGRSPDHAESAYIAFWTSQGIKDPKRDTSRIIF